MILILLISYCYRLLSMIPTAIDITITSIFHCFFSSLARSKFVFFFSFLFSLYGSLDDMVVLWWWWGLFDKLILELVFWLGLGDPFVSQSPSKFYAPHFFRTDSGLCLYHFVVRSNFNLLHNSQRNAFLNQTSALVSVGCIYLCD